MAKRQQDKARAKAEREARERELASAQRRKRRLWQLGAVAAFAVALVAVLVVISQSGNGDAPSAGTKNASGVVGAPQTTRLFAGIAQRADSLGDPSAPVVMTEYADLQCPFCRDYTLQAMPTLVQRYVRAGKVRMQLKLVSIIGPDSDKLNRAAASAATRNRLWNFADLTYRNQGEENSGWVTDELIGKLAAATPGLVPATVVAAANDPGSSTLPASWSAAAQAAGVNSTPTFTLARRGQAPERVNVSSLDASAFTGPIDSLLGGR
jgi:protein-disulfide isomerase